MIITNLKLLRYLNRKERLKIIKYSDRADRKKKTKDNDTDVPLENGAKYKRIAWYNEYGTIIIQSAINTDNQYVFSCTPDIFMSKNFFPSKISKIW